MQPFTRYKPNEAGSMPPPSNMGGGMNLGATRTNHQQQYQAHMRSNNQQIPPSSPGYVQSPPNFNTPTPPGSVGQQFYGQPLQSPTKPPASQPHMAAGSPQVGNNPAQQLQKQMVSGPGEVSKIDAARIDLLLELNKILLQEILQLQLNGRAGQVAKQNSDAQTGQQSPVTKEGSEVDGEKKGEEPTKKGPPPSREYVECMFRLRGNIAWLTSLASQNTAKPQQVIERPQIMEPLSANIEGNTISEESMNNIREMYKRLKELFPRPAQQQPVQHNSQAQQHMQPQQVLQQQQTQQQQNMTAQQQAQNMQQQILMHQQQMAAAAQAGNMQGMSPAGMGRGQSMNPQLMQQQMMARAMAGMQNQQNNFGQGI